MRALTFDPIVPLALWFPLAITALVLLGVYAWFSAARLPRRRQRVVLALMAVAIVLPLALLLNPTRVIRVPRPAGKPQLTVLVDTSASMQMADLPQGATRYSEALCVADQMTRQLSRAYDVRLMACSADAQRTDLSALSRETPTGMVTDLASCIEASLEDRPQGQALLLLSDGHHNGAGPWSTCADPWKRPGPWPLPFTPSRWVVSRACRISK